MKKLLIALAATATLGAAAAPAAAQPWGYGYERGHDRGYDRHYGGQLTTSYVDSLEWRINNAAREGRISWGSARQLRDELRQIQPLAWRVQTGQASRREFQRLSRGVDRIEAAVNSHSRHAWRDRDDDRRWRR